MTNRNVVLLALDASGERLKETLELHDALASAVAAASKKRVVEYVTHTGEIKYSSADNPDNPDGSIRSAIERDPESVLLGFSPETHAALLEAHVAAKRLVGECARAYADGAKEVMLTSDDDCERLDR